MSGGKKFSKGEMNRVGETLKNGEFNWTYLDAINTLSQWRSLHSYPINTFQSTLRDRLKRLNISGKSLVAQRLKRTPSIIDKLRRESAMPLSRMQDIGGIRAIVPTMRNVSSLQRVYERGGRFKHELVRVKDYINSPKESGYRSVHLIYRYKSDAVPECDGLLLELQIRTKVQHAWATAVETMGFFLNQSLKSSQGSEEWLDFFSLTSAAFCHLEKTNVVPGYDGLTQDELFKEVKKVAAKLKVKQTLKGYSVATNYISSKRMSSSELTSAYYLLVLNPDTQTINIESFGRRSLQEANLKYYQVEQRMKDGENIQVVLVSAGSVKSLRKAYPNFFLDTQEFLNLLDKITSQV